MAALLLPSCWLTRVRAPSIPAVTAEIDSDGHLMRIQPPKCRSRASGRPERASAWREAERHDPKLTETSPFTRQCRFPLDTMGPYVTHPRAPRLHPGADGQGESAPKFSQRLRAAQNTGSATRSWSCGLLGQPQPDKRQGSTPDSDRALLRPSGHWRQNPCERWGAVAYRLHRPKEPGSPEYDTTDFKTVVHPMPTSSLMGDGPVGPHVRRV